MISLRVAKPQLIIVILMFQACSSGAASGDFDKALSGYEQTVTGRSNAVADTLASTYLEKLAAGETNVGPAVLDQLEEEIADFNQFLCRRLEGLAGDAGSGDEKRQRMSDAGAISEQIVRDAVIAALVNKALAGPPESVDLALDRLGVEAVAPDGSALRGTAALQDAGLLDSQNRVTIPERDTAEYAKYLDWFGHEARGLSGPELVRGINNRIAECSSAS